MMTVLGLSAPVRVWTMSNAVGAIVSWRKLRKPGILNGKTCGCRTWRLHSCGAKLTSSSKELEGEWQCSSAKWGANTDGGKCTQSDTRWLCVRQQLQYSARRGTEKQASRQDQGGSSKMESGSSRRLRHEAGTLWPCWMRPPIPHATENFDAQWQDGDDVRRRCEDAVTVERTARHCGGMAHKRQQNGTCWRLWFWREQHSCRGLSALYPRSTWSVEETSNFSVRNTTQNTPSHFDVLYSPHAHI